ncbi:hypothetical protein J6590_032537 [Homalodisca vitripennis]|nr:hypothetical protein J6590_032537 [Homalodisca vitripennis]
MVPLYTCSYPDASKDSSVDPTAALEALAELEVLPPRMKRGKNQDQNRHKHNSGSQGEICERCARLPRRANAHSRHVQAREPRHTLNNFDNNKVKIINTGPILLD